MRFGPVPVAEAAGGVLAHALGAGGRRLRKGAVLGPAEVAALAADGVAEVTVARLDPGDVAEGAAAARLAAALAEGAGLVPGRAFTGRANLAATAAGVVAVDAA
ncbi:MAG: molybdopterin biosynthesis protein, partial [Rhodobacteraceae bacterium]|nr:molybdopterin biosynthesis protein [Paracoccaceae bacterium]